MTELVGIEDFQAPEEVGFMRALKDCGAGTVGGILQVLVGQPFDTVKVRLQTQPTPAAGKLPLYTGMLDCVAKTRKNEGFRAFYKGTATPLVGIGACVSIQFVTLESMKRLFRSRNDPGAPFTNMQLYIAGATSGLSNSVVSGPVEHIRTRLQVQTGEASTRAFQGPIDAVRKIYSTYGIKGIYKGQAVTMARELHGYGVYFMVYEYMVQRAMAKKAFRRDQITTWEVCAYGALAGYIMWSGVYPVDVVKSKLQTDGFTSQTRKYDGVLDCVRKVWATEGAKGFFRGFIPCMVRAAPVNAVTFLGFETAMRFLK